MESSFWRPFWERMNKKFPDRFSSLLDIVIGEMTGADKALISSLEGLEDLQLIGKLQLEDHGVRKGDVVFCITEGGETSSVIGTILTARRQYEEKDTEASKRNLFFIFNNPEEVLQHLDRSMEVLNNPGITKIPLWTGPQAVSGSTRMQATTSETFLAGVIMEQAIYEYLQDCEMTPSQLNDLGFEDGLTLKDRVLSFAGVQKASQATARDLAKLTDWEADTYAKGGNATYWSDTGMVTVFTDSTERSPTFGLHPLDTVDAKEKKCWIKVVTSSKDQKSAWKYFLRRDFKGLESARYKRSFQNDIEDQYLREAALTSLKHAGSEQVALYDFSCKDVHLEPPKVSIDLLSSSCNSYLT